MGCGWAAKAIEPPTRGRARQHALHLDGMRIEHQGELQKSDSLSIPFARCWPRMRSAGAENVFQHIGTLGSTGGLRCDQLLVERDGDPGGDVVLQSEQIARIAIEPLGP